MHSYKDLITLLIFGCKKLFNLVSTVSSSDYTLLILCSVLLEKNGKNQLDRSCEVCGIAEGQGGKEHLTYTKNKEG